VPTDASSPPAQSAVRPFFSIIIPAYNRADSVVAAIDSSLAQSCTDHEIIVVDDGSTDATAKRLAAYGDRIRVLRQANAGGGPARHLGISNARGEYVAFLDSDDVWPTWALETYRQVITESDCPSLLLGTAAHTDRDPRHVVIEAGALRYTRCQDFLASAPAYQWFGFSVIVVRRSCIPPVGALPASRVAAQDLFFLLMLGDQPNFVAVTSPVTAIYRRHPGNISGNAATLAAAMRNLIDQERRGLFAGGSERRASRRTLLCRSVRAASVTLLRTGMPAAAWELYRLTWMWQFSDGRWKYLFGFPVALVAGVILGLLTAGRGFTDRIPPNQGASPDAEKD
jgi:hypothetical protein